MTLATTNVLAIASVEARPYALRFTDPILTARGRFTHRRGWLLHVTDTEGRQGWGDAAPWPGFGSTDEEVSLQIGALTDGRIVGMRVEGVSEIASDVARRKLCPEVAYALELALLDLLGKRRQASIAALLSGEEPLAAPKTHVLVAGPIPSDAAWLKVKAGGQSLDALEARLSSIVAGAPVDARIRLDVGGGWDMAQASDGVRRLARYRVHTIEQPLPPGQHADLAALRTIAAENGVAIAADEDVTGIEALRSLLAAGAVDEVVLKPMFVGGLLAARRLARVATERGCRVTITNALESAIGRAGARHLAATMQGVHGLSDGLADDVATLPARCGDSVALPRGYGLGTLPRSPEASRSPMHQAIPNPLVSSAIARPEHVALHTSAGSMTYAALAERAEAGARTLASRGVGPGTRVALVGPRDAHWVSWLHAVAWIGATAVPLPHAAPEEERERIRRATAAEIIIATDTTPFDAEGGPAVDERFWPLMEPRVVICSSGSTGTPKPISLSTLQLVTSAFGSAIRLGHAHDDRWLACLPLHHVGGLSILFRCAFYGTTVVLEDRFDAERVATAIDEGEVTLVSLVPAMLAQVLDVRERRRGEARPFPSTLRAILLGGAHAPAGLRTRCQQIGAPVALTWGMTEAASQVATSFAGEQRVVPHAFARVASHDGRLAVSGPVVSQELSTPAGLITHDAGNVSSDGAVTVTGRADDIIISGGEKVAPAEIEQVLRRHPSIVDAAVIARPSLRWGRRPYAAVQTDQPLTEAVLQAWCRQHLAAFKVPDGFVCLPALPRAALGKVALGEVRQLLDAQFGSATRKAQP